MSCPLKRCPECSFYMGKYVEFITEYKKALYRYELSEKGKYKGYSPNKLVLKSDVSFNIEEVFDDLEIYNICCRMHLSSVTDFDRQFK